MFHQAHGITISGGNFYVVNGDLNYTINLPLLSTGRADALVLCPGDSNLPGDETSLHISPDGNQIAEQRNAAQSSGLDALSSVATCPLCGRETHRNLSPTTGEPHPEPTQSSTEATFLSTNQSGLLLENNSSSQPAVLYDADCPSPTHSRTLTTNLGTRTDQFNIQGEFNLHIHVHSPGTAQINIYTSHPNSGLNESDVEEAQVYLPSSSGSSSTHSDC